MARLGGTVLRRPVADVEAEIAAAEEAQRNAQREATKELVRGRRERTKEQVHTKVDAPQGEAAAARQGGERGLLARRLEAQPITTGSPGSPPAIRAARSTRPDRSWKAGPSARRCSGARAIAFAARTPWL